MNQLSKFLICSLGLMIGERTLLSSPPSDLDSKLNDARMLLSQHQFEKARTVVGELLKEGKRSDIQQLMAEIIDQEIVEEKKSRSNEPEETVPKQVEIEKWLERSRSFLDIQQYEEALLAAEKVFTYDAYNLKASRLIDAIRHKALEEGKRGIDALGRISEEEISERIKNYHRQAQAWISKQRWGAAKMAVDKILLLNPYDRAALKLKEAIQAHTNEKRKTL